MDQLREILEQAGVKVWRDTADIWPGQDWRLAIRDAITTGSLAFIACFSENSQRKGSSYQNEELSLAVDQMRLRQPGVPWLIPVRFDTCSLPAFDLGRGRMLDSLQRADLFGPGYQAQAERLILAIQRILADTPGSVTGEGAVIRPSGAAETRHTSIEVPTATSATTRTGAANGPGALTSRSRLQSNVTKIGNQAELPEQSGKGDLAPGRKRLDVQVIFAIIGGISVILAAVVAGIFALVNSGNSPNGQAAFPPPTAPEQVLNDPGSTGVDGIAYSPNGTVLAAGDLNGGTYLWDTATMASGAPLRNPDGQGVYGVAFSPDGRLVAAGNVNSAYTKGSITLWNAKTGKLAATLIDRGGTGVGGGVAFSPDGTILAAADGNGGIYLRNVATHQLAMPQPLRDPGGTAVYGIAFSPHGDTLAAADKDGSVYLWNAKTGKLAAAPLADPGSKGIQGGVAFSRDGRLLAAGDLNGHVYVWDVATGKLAETLTGRDDLGINGVAFSPLGNGVAATSNNSQHTNTIICVWDLTTHRLATFRDPRSEGAFRLAFSPDGKTVAVGDANANTYLWDMRWLNP